MIIIKPLELFNMQKIVDERNKVQETLRTPFMLTLEQQEKWYEEVICNRQSNIRYWEFWYDKDPFTRGDEFIGYGGIENISWENSTGEISLLVFEKYRKQGFGKQCVDKIIDQAFNYLGLQTLWGEVYYCGNIEFWQKVLEKVKEKHNVKINILPMRKYWKGVYWDSYHFTIINSFRNGVRDGYAKI